MCLAIPGKIEELFEKNGAKMARVNFNGIKRAVCTQCVPEATVGSYVLVHVGFALSVIDEEEAARTLAMLKAGGELEKAKEELTAS